MAFAPADRSSTAGGPAATEGARRPRVEGVVAPPRTPRAALAVLAVLGLTGLSVWGTEFDLLQLVAGAGPIQGFAAQMFPPDVSAETLATTRRGLVETLQMSFLGALLGAVAALPLALLGTADDSPAAGGRRTRAWAAVPAQAARLALNLFRSIPDILWALAFVVALGLGPFPGTLALAVHSAGVLGKLLSEALETVPPRPVQAVAAIGMPRLGRLLFARLPQASAQGGSLVLYQWECNIRSAAILGFVGAGGIGQEILISMNLFDYPRVATLVGATVLAVLAVDRLSAALRRRLSM